MARRKYRHSYEFGAAKVPRRKKFSHKQRAAYWKKKYLDLRADLEFYTSKSWKRTK